MTPSLSSGRAARAGRITAITPPSRCPCSRLLRRRGHRRHHRAGRDGLRRSAPRGPTGGPRRVPARHHPRRRGHGGSGADETGAGGRGPAEPQPPYGGQRAVAVALPPFQGVGDDGRRLHRWGAAQVPIWGPVGDHTVCAMPRYLPLSACHASVKSAIRHDESGGPHSWGSSGPAGPSKSRGTRTATERPRPPPNPTADGRCDGSSSAAAEAQPPGRVSGPPPRSPSRQARAKATRSLPARSRSLNACRATARSSLPAEPRPPPG
ncbi:hypothetical protein QF035_009264 [Streptomyces umbrinus]|uniref:Uncharacterized protein n=1 Tax=Streptomyces umbrinus TaxID=67370 RepID=A0ABU0T791_9ACTN|nr:hypothetical protein [Streptomyces umbrinus]